MKGFQVLVEKLSKPAYMIASFVLFVITAMMVNFVFKPEIQYLTQTYNYTPDAAYHMLNDYGEAGRSAHLYVLIADIVMVLLYTLFLTTAINKTFGKILRSGKLLILLCLFPLLLALVQLMEVAGVYGLLAYYPKRLDGMAEVTVILTSTKCYLTYICFVLPAVGFILSKLLRHRNVEENSHKTA